MNGSILWDCVWPLLPPLLSCFFTENCCKYKQWWPITQPEWGRKANSVTLMVKTQSNYLNFFSANPLYCESIDTQYVPFPWKQTNRMRWQLGLSRYWFVRLVMALRRKEVDNVMKVASSIIRFIMFLLIYNYVCHKGNEIVLCTG